MLKGGQRLPLLLAVAGALLTVRLVLTPLINWQNTLAGENHSLARQVAKAEQLLFNAPALAERRTAVRAILDSTELKLAKGGQKAELTQQQSIEKLLEDADLTLRSFNWVLKETLPLGHERLRAEAHLAGSLPSLLKGIHALSSRTPHTDVADIELKLNRREQQLTGQGLGGKILIDVITDGAE